MIFLKLKTEVENSSLKPTVSKTHRYQFRKDDQKSIFISPEGNEYHFGYDQLGRLAKIRFQAYGAERAFSYSDYHHGAVKKIIYPDGSVEDRDYDRYMRFVKADLTLESGTTQRRYEWDKVDRLIRDGREGEKHRYDYDDMNRIIGVADQDETTLREAYGYKTNLFLERKYNWETDFEYNGKHQLEKMIKESVETRYQYNLNGNLTKKITPDHTFTYEYDALNQLSVIKKDGAVIAKYLYDPFGRRIQKKIGETITRFVYSDEGLIGQYSETGSLQLAFVWRLDGVWGTNPLLQVTAEDVYVYHNDHRGAPERLNTLDGVAVWEAKKESFGKLISVIADVTQPLGLPGQYFDNESGLYYNYHRYYDAEAGRYITQDPIGFDGGISLYAYAGGDPIGLIDPLGLLSFLPQWLVDFSAGFGDAISFGLTKKIRQKMGTDGEVNPCSAAYGVGDFVGEELQDHLLGKVGGRGQKRLKGRPFHQKRLDHQKNKKAIPLGPKKTNFHYDKKKIGKQMKKRGWSDELINDTLSNPHKTVETRDRRWLKGHSKPFDDPATAFIRKDASYVVKNDITDQIVQISNRNDPNWISPWE